MFKINTITACDPTAQSTTTPQDSCIHHLLEAWAEQTPEAIAIAAPGHTPLSYRQLLSHVDNVVKTLRTLGIGRSDQIAMMLPNGPEAAVAFLAGAAGATAAPLNPGYRDEELDFYLTDLSPKALIVQAGTHSPAKTIAQRKGIPFIELSPTIEAAAGIFTLQGTRVSSPVQDELAGPEDLALVLYTSGTTSRPKRVPLTHNNLCTSAYNITDTLKLDSHDRCLNIIPLFHIHGLMGALLSSITAGASVVCTPDFYAPQFFDWMEEFNPTWYTAVPTMHQAILARVKDHREMINRSSLRFIRSSSAPLPAKARAELEDIFKVPVIEAYGMTEASHQIASTPLPPGKFKAGSVGIAAGPEIAIRDDAGNLLPSGETGEIIIRGTNVTHRYENDEKANQDTSINGWFPTGDLGYLDTDGYLFITGRIKEIINRGGEKISPYEVEAVLLDHPEVLQAVTFPVADPTLGEDVGAAVVLKENAILTQTDIQCYTAKRLADFKIPRQVVTVDELPKGPTGKVQRIGLAEKLGLATGGLSEIGQTEWVAPRTVLEAELTEVWAQVLRVDRVGVNDNFFQLGGDSISAARIINRVRESMQVELSILSFFESPTVARMAECIHSSGPENPIPEPLTLRPIARTGKLPLSYSQQRLWFFDQVDPGNPAYNRGTAFRLTGRLDVEVLQRCIDEIVRRHAVLRSRFPATDGKPEQVVAPDLSVNATVIEMYGLPEGEREAQALRRMTEEIRRPFDLALGPLLRVRLVHIEDHVYVLLLVTHHVVSDGWSDGIFLREIAALYDAFSKGRPSPLPEPPVQFADYAQWQRKWLEGDLSAKQLSYWKQRLKNLPSLVELPTDHPRPPLQTYRGGRYSMVFPGDLTQALNKLSRDENATLFMTLLAAFKILLHRYSGQEDLLVGVPVAGRGLVATEGLIGNFINTLVLRSDFSGTPTFRELLQQVREAALGAYAHQDLPIEKLVEELQVERRLDRNPLFQVMFQLRNLPKQEVNFPGLQVNEFQVDAGTAKLDLALEIIEEDGKLACWFEYNVDLFDRVTIIRMGGHFQSLLNGIVADGDQRLSVLPLLNQAKRHQLLVEWNKTKRDYPKGKCVHEVFEEQVEQTPDNVAVVFPSTGSGQGEDEQLTYWELNRRANQLAHHLQKLGVGPEVLVGICMERSLEMVVGILGILKAGGAYVPLDPTYPRERLSFMLEDTEAPVLLTQQRLLNSLQLSALGTERSYSPAPKVVCLDTDQNVIARESEENRASGVTASNLAYVIYTSGSTGRAKGVEITHRALVNFTTAGSAAYELGSGDRVLQFASVSFDAAVEEIFSCFLRGATLVLRTDSMLDSVPVFLQKCRDWEITVLDLPTVYWHEMTSRLSLDHIAIPEQLRLVIIGGEKALPERLAQWQQCVDGRVRLLNTYGPTETTVVATRYELTGTVRATASPQEVPIGRPIPNVQTYILDKHLNAVPLGVPGELYIGGAGLARGYLNRPELTTEKFVPNPFNDDPGARLYKTGDLARYRPDGNIEFLGRIDQQVKIRGFRIELGEVESVLSQHPTVRESVTLAREDTPGDKRLVAYVVSKQEPPMASELRSFLKEKLPDYMIPSAFVMLDALPLTPNGKVDRRALPAPDQSRPELEGAFVASRTPIEEALARIWAEILKLEQVGIYDNFFELGGHSLLATQLISRLRSVFGVELPLRSLFETPTVAGLAERIETARQSDQDLKAPSIVPVSRDGNLPLSFAQQRLWFLDQLEPGSTAYNMPKAVRLTGPLNVAVLEQSLNEILRRHEALRTTFSAVEGQPVQVIAPAGPLALPVVSLQNLPEIEREAEAQRLANEEERRPFDLSQGPLFRVVLLCLGEKEHVLLLTMHHIVSDGWSMGVFVQELSALYEAFSAGKPSPLPELPIQYADFAVWQRNWLQGEILDSQLGYWKKQLADAPPLLELPTDYPRPAIQTFRGASQSLLLPQSLSEGLRALSRQSGVTLFMTLLAAFKTLLYRYTGQEDIVVGSHIAGRNRAEIEGLIGFFIGTLVLRSDLSRNPSFRELLGRVREVALGAYAHQDLPFEKLVEELQPERNLSYTPLFQVFFNMINLWDGKVDLAGLTAEPFGSHEPTSKFDLTMYAVERNEGTHLRLVYKSDLFNAATIARMLEHFQTLLEGIVVNPEQRLSDLPILTDKERRQLLVEWNDTATEYPRDKCIHQLFEAQVERTPDALAVAFEDKQLTYRELNARANQLAHYLRKQGVGPEVLVGICVKRSLEMIIGVLGVLKAGGAYVLLDPAYPKERLAFMLEDAQAPVLLTQQRLMTDLPTQNPKSEIQNPIVFCLDTDWNSIAQESEENLTSEVRAYNLAYVIYTSGSTGAPKGVMIEHRQIVNYIQAISDRYLIKSGSSFALVQPFSFDASKTCVFGSLTSGGVLHLIAEDKVSDPAALASYFARFPMTFLKITPSHLAALETSFDIEKLLPRELLMLGGEPSNSDWVKGIENKTRGLTILNHYGPTETTIGVATYKVEQPVVLTVSNTLPLGRPLSNTQIYILDQHLNPVPVGVTGELYISGAGLARGYLNRPELTAEKFIPSVFTDLPGQRLYRTGDRARYLPDGNIEFIGRTDDQVKIRGYRIEPGEIEAVMRQHPDVRDTAVLARENSDGQKQLIAYTVIDPQRSPTVAGKPRYQLPNGAAVAQLNKNETDYIYEEIFKHQVYLKHGITVQDGDCIFDVGANIGLFTVFANQITRDPRVYSFEPNPTVFEILSANATLYGSDVRLFNCGLSDQAKTAEFTFFPGFSLLSGSYADAQREKELIKTFMSNQEQAGVAEMAELVEQADTLLEQRFEPQSFSAELRTLSSIIEQESIENIDLLKINVEKSELDVLKGIRETDWWKIKQIILEVDVRENLPNITSLLKKYGFEFVIDQELLLAGTPLCYVYALRPSKERALIPEQQNGAHIQSIPVLRETLLSTREIRDFLRKKLPDYMIPSAFVFLDALPLTPNSKVDRKALPEPDQTWPESEQTFVAPHTLVEEALAEIWSKLLGIERVGVHDNFFELGGHSLLATQVVSRVRKALRVELPLRTLFEKPTIEELAGAIVQNQIDGPAALMFAELEALSDKEAQQALRNETL